MKTTKILLVDCEHRLAAIIKERIAAVIRCPIEETAGIQATLDRVSQGGLGLLLWYVARDYDREQVLRQLASVAMQQIPLIAVTDADDQEFRLQLLAHGAIDCLAQPIDQSRLEFLVDILTVKARYAPCAADHKQHVANEKDSTPSGSCAAHTLPTWQLMQMLSRVAPMDTTVLLSGETGAGKTYTARVIHDLSPRRHRPFVAVHCGALPPSLLESELFGHCRGAFTGADRDQAGKLAAAEDGTVLLDEIDSVPLEAQVKLLQVVEERNFEPLGSVQTQHFRARLIAAANRPLEKEVAEGRFRPDLYYRLNVVAFHMPPLRQRPEAILPLARTFLENQSRETGRQVPSLSDAAAWALESYSWPGNIRELRNVIERTLVLCQRPVVGLVDLPESIQMAYGNSRLHFERPPPAAANALAAARSGAELELLRDVLQRRDSNRTAAAAELGISRVTLYKKLHKLGLM